MKIKNIIFDLGGVLIDWNPEYVYLKEFVGKSRLHGSVRDTKTKTDNVRRQFKSTRHE